MVRDSIIEEVRAARDAFAKAHGYKLQEIVAALRKQPLPKGARVISLPPKRISKAGAAF